MKINNIVKWMMLCNFLICSQAYSAPDQNTIDACADKDEGDVCSFTNEQGDSVDGACQYISNDESALICKVNQ